MMTQWRASQWKYSARLMKFHFTLIALSIEDFLSTVRFSRIDGGGTVLSLLTVVLLAAWVVDAGGELGTIAKILNAK